LASGFSRITSYYSTALSSLQPCQGCGGMQRSILTSVLPQCPPYGCWSTDAVRVFDPKIIEWNDEVGPTGCGLGTFRHDARASVCIFYSGPFPPFLMSHKPTATSWPSGGRSTFQLTKSTTSLRFRCFPSSVLAVFQVLSLHSIPIPTLRGY